MFDTAIDIKTLLEQMGDDLHNCQSCIRSILTKNLNGILIMDQSWIILFANPAAEGFFNEEEHGLLGRPFNFGRTEFNCMGSDLSKYPIGHAVVSEHQKPGDGPAVL